MTLTDFEGRDYPPLIQRAMSRAMSPTLDLTPSERLALTTLLSRVEARDGAAAFWVRRLNVAESFGRVERTITNWLSALEEKGWISKEQGRTRWGSFQSLTLHLTDAAARYLGLTNQSDLSTTYRKKTSVGIRNQESSHSFGDNSQRLLENPNAAKNRIPDDCKVLLDLRVTPRAIFKLMGLASRGGQRLSDVLASKGAAIAKAKHPFSYISALLSTGTDFKWLRQHHAEDMAKQAVVSKEEEDIARAKQLAAGRTFTDGADMVVFNADSSAMLFRQDALGQWLVRGAIVGAPLRQLWLRHAAVQSFC